MILEIMILVITSLMLIISVIALIMIYKKKPSDVNNNQIDLKEIGAISNQLNQLSKNIKDDIELAVTKEMTKSYKVIGEQNENNNVKLERFQANITESINKRFDALNEQMNNRLDAINKKVDEKLQEGFKGTSESMAQVRERLQAIDDAQKNIEELSKDVVSLKNVLEGNQTRGKYGEYQLSMVLNSVFGDTIGCYEEQYTIKKARDGNDVRADAVVFMPEPNKMICIDSKFPFQDYNRLLPCRDVSRV